MPSQEHETWIELLRKHPELAAGFVRSKGHAGLLPRRFVPEVDSGALTTPVPAERLADLLVVLRTGKRARLVIVVEVQLEHDPLKRYRWPHYEAAAHDRYECPTVLLVVAPRPRVARWAAQPIPMGAGGRICPVVIGPSEIPVVKELAEARQTPELAVLSAIAHGRGEPGLAAHLAALAEFVLDGLPRQKGLLYSDLIRAALSPAAKRILEARMALPNYVFKSDFAIKHQAKGREEGREEGLAIARETLILALQRTFGELPSGMRERLRAADAPTLQRWSEAFASATSLAQLEARLDER